MKCMENNRPAASTTNQLNLSNQPINQSTNLNLINHPAGIATASRAHICEAAATGRLLIEVFPLCIRRPSINTCNMDHRCT